MAGLDSLLVRDFMTKQLMTFTADMDVMAAIHQLVTSGHSGAPVVDANGHLIGMLSERDCLKVGLTATYGGECGLGGPVREYMSTSVASIRPDATLLEVANRFLDASYKRLPVVDGTELLGQISRSDLLRAINSLC